MAAAHPTHLARRPSVTRPLRTRHLNARDATTEPHRASPPEPHAASTGPTPAADGSALPRGRSHRLRQFAHA